MVLGLTTAVTLLMPSLALVAAITIIGIPIALFMAAAPGLFLFALMVLAIRRPMIGHWYATYAAGCAALFILGVIPQIFNDRLDRQVAELVAGDHAEFQGPLSRHSPDERGSEFQSAVTSGLWQAHADEAGTRTLSGHSLGLFRGKNAEFALIMAHFSRRFRPDSSP